VQSTVAALGSQGTRKTRERDSPVMVLVAAGSFLRGSPSGVGDADERPQKRLSLKSFWIDRLEITVRQYGVCVKAGSCSAPPQAQRAVAARAQCSWGRDDRQNHPINCLTWQEADSYCRWVGARLPTEAEWEKAARGSDGRPYPWGNEPPSCRLAVMPVPLSPAGSGCGRKSTWPVGSKPAGASPSGALDMSGNVWEWVADYYDEQYFARAPSVDPAGPASGAARAIRGGGWEVHDLDHLRAANRFRFAPSFRFHAVGVRCAQSSD